MKCIPNVNESVRMKTLNAILIKTMVLDYLIIIGCLRMTNSFSGDGNEESGVILSLMKPKMPGTNTERC